MKLLIFFVTVVFSLNSIASVCENREKADKSLLLLVDVSGSMDSEERATQMKAYSNVILDEGIKQNLLTCSCVAMSVMFFAEDSSVVYPFTKMKSEKDISQLANFFQQASAGKLSSDYFMGEQTFLVDGLDHAKDHILEKAPASYQYAIDVSGDGMDTRAHATKERAREINKTLYESEVVVNGISVDIYKTDPHVETSNRIHGQITNMPTYQTDEEYPSVSAYYEKEVITPNGNLEKIEATEDFEKAFKKRLSLETCNLMM